MSTCFLNSRAVREGNVSLTRFSAGLAGQRVQLTVANTDDHRSAFVSLTPDEAARLAVELLHFATDDRSVEHEDEFDGSPL